MASSKISSMKTGTKAASKSKKTDRYSFESLLRNPELRSLLPAKKSKSELANKKKSKFYEKLVLDTKPTNSQTEPDVRAKVMSDPDFPADSMNYVGETLLEFKKSLVDVPPGEVRAVFLHTTLDDIMQEEDTKAQEYGEKLELTCKKGCAHCCHKLVYVTPDEGALLARKLLTMEGGKELSKQTMANLNFQASFQPHQQLDYWMLDQQKTKCPFLAGDNSCRIYEDRPANCRLLRVRSPAYRCSKQATMRGDDVIDQNLTLMGEMLLSAAYDLTISENRNILSIQQAILSNLEYVKSDGTKKIVDEMNKGFDHEMMKRMEAHGGIDPEDIPDMNENAEGMNMGAEDDELREMRNFQGPGMGSGSPTVGKGQSQNRLFRNSRE